MPIEQISVKNKEELTKIVMEEISAIEAGLTVIYSNIKIDPKTNLDVLCRDGEGRLVVMQLNHAEDDNMFFEGLRCLNYIDTVKPMLKAAYGQAKIDDSATPRLILLAPSFSHNLRNVVENTNVIEVDLCEWDYLQIGDKKGLYAHPVFVKKTRPKATFDEEKPKKAERKAKSQPFEPLPRKREEPEPAPPEPPAMVIPPAEETPQVETKKTEKEKRKSIFSL